MKKLANELGRSMVEMLAVLMIIIILSALGITGYETVVDREKANQIMTISTKLLRVSNLKGYNVTLKGERMPHPKEIGDVKVMNQNQVKVTVAEDYVTESLLKTLEHQHGLVVEYQENELKDEVTGIVSTERLLFVTFPTINQ